MRASEASELKKILAFILRVYHVLTIKLLQIKLLTGSLINQLNDRLCDGWRIVF